MGAEIPKQFRFWNWPRAFGGSGSGSRTDSDILAVPGPVLKDFFPRVRFSGTWTDPTTTLALAGVTGRGTSFGRGMDEKEGREVKTVRMTKNCKQLKVKVSTCQLNFSSIWHAGRNLKLLHPDIFLFYLTNKKTFTNTYILLPVQIEQLYIKLWKWSI